MTSQNQSLTSRLGQVDDFVPGAMVRKSVPNPTGGERALVVIRTSKGLYALDNACPHQGYGLATGNLALTGDGDGGGEDGDDALLTCQWHNWKFRASDGVCVMGEEDVVCHEVSVAADGTAEVTITEPSIEEKQAALWPSLRSGIAKDYTGQIARDTVRLLETDASPADIMWAGLEQGAGRNDYGPGHEMAMAADCLHLAEVLPGEQRALPLIQGLAGIADQTRDRPERLVPPADGSVDLGAAIENEEVESAMASAATASDRDVAEIRHQFIDAVSRHHLSYGHGAIYTQKAFELLERVGWDRASGLLPHLAVSVATATREDTLPYMAKAMRQLEAVDLDALATAKSDRDDGWSPAELVQQLLVTPEPPIALAADAIMQGAGVEGLLDAISLAVSERLLRHDVATDFTNDDDFVWLDITHGLTYARAARWAWQHDPGPHTARLALFSAWLCFDTGRAERRLIKASGRPVLTPEPDGVVARALSDDPQEVGDQLAADAMDDRGGSFIVVAHLIKTVQAAREEVAATGSKLPLAAAARFVHAPRRERFVARTVAESLDFVRTGRPPKR